MPILDCIMSCAAGECCLEAGLCPCTFRTKIRTRFNIAVCDGSYWAQLYDD